MTDGEARERWSKWSTGDLLLLHSRIGSALAVRASRHCPMTHRPTPHRDGLQPWCRWCGCDGYGYPVKALHGGTP